MQQQLKKTGGWCVHSNCFLLQLSRLILFLRAEAGFTDIEVGSRSLIEPLIARGFTSMVGEQFKGSPFADEKKMESHGVGDIERNSKAFNIVIGSDSYF